MQSGLADSIGTAGVDPAGITACPLHTLVRVGAVSVRDTGGGGGNYNHSGNIAIALCSLMLLLTFRFAFSVGTNECVLRTGAEDSSDGGAVLHPTYLGVVTGSGGLAGVLTLIVDAGQSGPTVIIHPTL